ncbi:hypothetical protein TEA_003158 [Camellia sinensis var. sinensis]|uniref:Chromatin structure-remodeling complex protein BSH n=1 Tax=Camellia sinensis var. sinensis TaxID=542762 RepID=A0A4S4E927_CAMSN|nr:hypothetical protein TEA_003158 [Camellia sinensis var. sinensis]
MVVLLDESLSNGNITSLERSPTADNLVPIRLDIEIDGQRFRDAFTWNPSDPDSEVVVFARRTVKDLKLPPAFVTQIAQSIQSQLTEFRSFEGQDMYTGEKIVPIKDFNMENLPVEMKNHQPMAANQSTLDLRVNHTLIKDQFLWDLNNFDCDPEEFARTFCRDLGIEDPEVGPAIAVAIREQLYEIAIQSVASARETRINKKGRRGAEQFPARFEYMSALSLLLLPNQILYLPSSLSLSLSLSKAGGTAVDLMKLFGNKSSAIRKRREWDVYEPIVDILSNEEVDALEAREERDART